MATSSRKSSEEAYAESVRKMRYALNSYLNELTANLMKRDTKLQLGNANYHDGQEVENSNLENCGKATGRAIYFSMVSAGMSPISTHDVETTRRTIEKIYTTVAAAFRVFTMYMAKCNSANVRFFNERMRQEGRDVKPGFHYIIMAKHILSLSTHIPAMQYEEVMALIRRLHNGRYPFDKWHTMQQEYEKFALKQPTKNLHVHDIAQRLRCAAVVIGLRRLSEPIAEIIKSGLNPQFRGSHTTGYIAQLAHNGIAFHKGTPYLISALFNCLVRHYTIMALSNRDIARGGSGKITPGLLGHGSINMFPEYVVNTGGNEIVEALDDGLLPEHIPSLVIPPSPLEDSTTEERYAYLDTIAGIAQKIIAEMNATFKHYVPQGYNPIISGRTPAEMMKFDYGIWQKIKEFIAIPQHPVPRVKTPTEEFLSLDSASGGSIEVAKTVSKSSTEMSKSSIRDVVKEEEDDGADEQFILESPVTSLIVKVFTERDENSDVPVLHGVERRRSDLAILSDVGPEVSQSSKTEPIETKSESDRKRLLLDSL